MADQNLEAVLLERFQSGAISFDVFQQLLTQLQDGTLMGSDRDTTFTPPPPNILTGGTPTPQSSNVPQETLGLEDTLRGIFSGSSGLDKFQQSGALSLLGPAGSVANFGLGQFNRLSANEEFPELEGIGFLEDILRPDLIFGSPRDIQVQRKKFSPVASNVAAKNLITQAEAKAREAKNQAQKTKNTRDITDRLRARQAGANIGF